MQVMGLMNDFDVPWPASVEQLWSVTGSASTVPVSASFVTCTLQLSYYARFWLAATAPLTGAAVLLVMPLYNRLVSTSAHWGRYRTGVLVISVLLYPTTAREVVRMLDCSEDLGGASYLRADFRVSCDTAKHSAHVAVAVVVLLVYCCGLPIATAATLHRRYKAGTLHADRTRRRFLFLMDGFTDRRASWESVVLLRKFAIVTISAVLGGTPYQVYYGVLVVVLALAANVFGRPYVDAHQGRMENASLTASSVSLYAGLLYTIGGLGEGTKALVALVVFAVNLTFIGYVLKVAGGVAAARAARRVRSRFGLGGGGGIGAGGVGGSKGFGPAGVHVRPLGTHWSASNAGAGTGNGAAADDFKQWVSNPLRPATGAGNGAGKRNGAGSGGGGAHPSRASSSSSGTRGCNQSVRSVVTTF